MNYKFSIFTGEHDPANLPFLWELYHSILAQTYTNWEWVILTNNGCTPADIPEIIRNDASRFMGRFYFQALNKPGGVLKNITMGYFNLPK
jgi:hypothetical protein